MPPVEEIDIAWQVEDGYVGKSRPQYTTVDIEEFESLTAEEIEDYINDSIQADFEETICWCLDEDVEEIVSRILQALSDKKKKQRLEEKGDAVLIDDGQDMGSGVL